MPENSLRVVSLFCSLLSHLEAGDVLAETPSLQGKLTFNGKLLLSTVEPSFWFRNEDLNQVAGNSAEYENGKYEVYGLGPGQYGMSVNVNLNPENPPLYPGDLRSWKVFSVTQGATTRLRVDLTELIHLVKPENNGRALPNWGATCGQGSAFTSPVTFEWEPIAEGANYHYEVTKLSCDPFTVGDAIAHGTTRDTAVTISLERNGTNDLYRFRLSARKNGKAVGSLMTHGESGHGWDYRFRVK